MANVVIYTKKTCPYCAAAKALFQSKEISYSEIDVESDERIRQEMIEKSGGRMGVPQVFIDGKHIGGFDDVKALDDEGKLDSLLK